MGQKKTIDALNKLVEINNDRIEGYETALKEIHEPELKSIFSQFVQTSLRCNQELKGELDKLGGYPTESTKIIGKFFRVWMDLKTALANNERKAILSSCEYGEDHALNIYEKVLAEDMVHLSLAQQKMISNQYSLIKSDHNKIKALREVLV